MLPPEPAYTVREIADHLRVAVSTVRRLIRLRELRAVWITPKKLRVRQSDLDAYLHKHRTDARPVSRNHEVAVTLTPPVPKEAN